jgi:hypothetical protein
MLSSPSENSFNSVHKHSGTYLGPLVDGFALGSIGASAPNLTQAADVVRVAPKKSPSRLSKLEMNKSKTSGEYFCTTSATRVSKGAEALYEPGVKPSTKVLTRGFCRLLFS